MAESHYQYMQKGCVIINKYPTTDFICKMIYSDLHVLLNRKLTSGHSLLVKEGVFYLV